MHLEILYGYEFRKGKYMLNPRNLGANRNCPPMRGYGDDFTLSKNATPRGTVDNQLRYSLFENFDRKTENEFHKGRKELWKNRQNFDDTPHRWWEPDKVTPNITECIPFDKAKTGIPEWVENNLILYHYKTAGLKSRGLENNQLREAVLSCRYSHDPFLDYANGGCVEHGIHVWRPPLDVDLFMAEHLSECQPITRNMIHKIIPEGYKPPGRSPIQQFFNRRSVNQNFIINEDDEEETVDIDDIFVGEFEDSENSLFISDFEDGGVDSDSGTDDT